MIIYKTTNLLNGKIYVGKDAKNSPKYLGSGLILLRAIQKYGIENFKKEILEFCKTKQELEEREKFWIKTLNSQNSETGYNIASGGFGGDTLSFHPNKVELFKRHSELRRGKKLSEEWKMRISLGLKGRIFSLEERKQISKRTSGTNNPMYHKHHSEESKKKISEASKERTISEVTRNKISQKNKGRTHSLETKLKISKSKTGVKSSIETRHKISLGKKGKKLSEEVRARMSIAKKGKVFSEDTKKKMSNFAKTRTGQLNGNYKHFTEDQKFFILKNLSMTCAKISRELNISYARVANYLKSIRDKI